jgi:hypothetical protein
MEEVNLTEAHLERAILIQTNLQKAILIKARMEEARLAGAILKEALLNEIHLEGADLEYTHLEGADLLGAHLEGARCCRTFFDSGTRLNGVTLSDEKHGSVSIADVSWGNVNLSVVKWSQVEMLGDEQVAWEKKRDGKVKDKDTILEEYEVAVRASRQLAVVLQTQGLNEDAARFTYRAQKLQRGVLWYQRKFGQYLFSLFLSLTSGYGYRMWRSFATYVLVIVSFATAYYLLGSVAKLSLSPLDAIIFSVTSFHGRGFSPGENIGLSNPLTIFAAIEAFVGLIIEVTLIATLTQRFFGK